MTPLPGLSCSVHLDTKRFVPPFSAGRHNTFPDLSISYLLYLKAIHGLSFGRKNKDTRVCLLFVDNQSEFGV